MLKGQFIHFSGINLIVVNWSERFKVKVVPNFNSYPNFVIKSIYKRNCSWQRGMHPWRNPT